MGHCHSEYLLVKVCLVFKIFAVFILIYGAFDNLWLELKDGIIISILDTRIGKHNI